MKHYIQNLSLVYKVTGALIFVSIVGNLTVSAISYYEISASVENMLGKRLEHVARTAALMVDSKDHRKLVRKYLAQKTDIDQTPEFLRIQKTLRDVQKANSLSSDIYTYFLPDWADDTMVFIAMSNEETYVGNGIEITEAAQKAKSDNEAIHTQIYQDSEGMWISGIAPIQNSKGKTIGYIEVDYNAHQEVAAAKTDLFQQLIIAAAASLALSLLLGALIGRALTRPVRELANAVEQFRNGLPMNMKASCEDEVGMLTQSFQKMTEEVQQQKEEIVQSRDEAISANKAKSQFLANMSHELRTPLNGILGYVELLQLSQIDASQRNQLETVESSGRHLLSLLNDLLDFSKIEAQKMELEKHPFQLKKLAQEVEKWVAPQAKAQGIQFDSLYDSNLPASLMGDEGRVKQVILNLVSNAVKFTKEGQVQLKITKVSLPELNEKSVKLRIEVIDSGIGIPEGRKEQIFSAFEQADISDTRNYGGTGLGLSISQNIVHQMGASIQVESEVGKGSRFFFELSLEVDENAADVNSSTELFCEYIEGEAQVEAAEQPSEKSSSTLKILVVEDNPINQQVTLAMLESLGYTADIAENGQLGVDMASKCQYQMVLMDCQMPVLDGFDATQAIRQKDTDIPIVAMTANAFPETKTKCEEVGMNDFLTKPVSTRQLQEVFENHLNALTSVAA